VKHYNKMARQAGMTLIELTVVLLVLVGLAGLLIPYVSGFVTKTHDSTGASNIQALNNAVQRYAVEHYDNFPDKLDSLVEGSGATAAPFTKMMSTSFYDLLILDADKAASLTKAGINTVMEMDPSTTNATFNNTNNEIAVADTVRVLEINTTAIPNLAAVMGKPLDTANNHYVVFGLGDDSTIAGQTVSDVPVHFAQNANMGADKRYNHFVLVFEVPKAAYCKTATFMAFNPGTHTDGTASTVVKADLDAESALQLTSANCLAAAALYLTANEDGVIGTDGAGGMLTMSTFEWVVPAASGAKFIGSAMSMMNDFEGLGGSLNRYYENTATN